MEGQTMYTLDEVEAAERRIRNEVPDAKFSRDDYDWTLIVATPDKSLKFIVFQHNDYGLEIYGDVGRIIRELKNQHAAGSSNSIRTGP